MAPTPHHRLDASASESLDEATPNGSAGCRNGASGGKPAPRARRIAPPDADAPTNDPVRVYLREMGQVSLLTREGEVAIAKRIEAGQYARQLAVLATPYGVREILSISELLRKGSVDLRSVLDGLDEIEPTHTHDERRKDFVLKTAKVKRIDAEVAKKLACVSNSRTSEDTRKRLRGEIDDLLRQVVDLMRETRFLK